MTRAHGGLRGMRWVDKSSISGGRFGRMFRWLPGETYKRPDLEKLASKMIQLESAKLRDKTDPKQPHVPLGERFEEGPDILLDKPSGGRLLDTPFGTPEPGDENPTIPAGYTYFGQFIDHDLTFDPNSSLQKLNDPDALEDFRTPRFDLDSVYGRGPDDQPYLYRNATGIHFLLGLEHGNSGSPRPGDLPRNVDGRALVGDPRNDENAIVGQLQVVFLHFHNKVVDRLKVARPELSDHEVFLEAQRIVRWHYQYLVLTDYLPRIVGQRTWDRVYWGKPAPSDPKSPPPASAGAKPQPQPQLQFYAPKSNEAYMPVEFSVAAFRFGHSMVRPSYSLRPGEAQVGGSKKEPFQGDSRFHRIPIFSDNRTPGRHHNLSGFGALPAHWEINWSLFFTPEVFPKPAFQTQPFAGDEQGNDKGVFEIVGTDTQPSYRIDTQLVDPLAMLPPTVAKSGNMPDGIPVLAYRNLIRGSEFELPSGQNVARALGFEPLTDEALWGDYPEFKAPHRNPFAFRAPLWFYILKEAEQVRRQGFEKDVKGGHHLGDVGGSIVAEVLVGIALADHTSYLYQQPDWTPDKEPARSGFVAGAQLRTLYELVHWTTNGKMTFL